MPYYSLTRVSRTRISLKVLAERHYPLFTTPRAQRLGREISASSGNARPSSTTSPLPTTFYAARYVYCTAAYHTTTSCISASCTAASHITAASSAVACTEGARPPSALPHSDRHGTACPATARVTAACLSSAHHTDRQPIVPQTIPNNKVIRINYDTDNDITTYKLNYDDNYNAAAVTTLNHAFQLN